MTSSVTVRLNIEDGPDIELTPESAKDVYDQLHKLFGHESTPLYQPYPWNPLDKIGWPDVIYGPTSTEFYTDLKLHDSAGAPLI